MSWMVSSSGTTPCILIFRIIIFVIIVEHDVESKAEGNNEERVPEEKKEEWVEDSVEHGDIDIAGQELGMSANEGDEFCPRKHNGYGPQVSVEQEALLIIVEDNHKYQANHGQLNPVFKAGKVSF